MSLSKIGRKKELALSGVLVVALVLAAAGLFLFPDVAQAGLCEPRCSGTQERCIFGNTYICTTCLHPTYCIWYESCNLIRLGCNVTF